MLKRILALAAFILPLAVLWLLAAYVAHAETRFVAPGFPLPPDSAVEVMTKGGHGSGVYIGKGNFLTAGHVVQGEATVTIDGADADVLWVDTRRDVALLHVSATVTKTAAVVSCQPLIVGQDVTVVGWPKDLGKITTRGYVAGDEAKRDAWEHSYVLVDAITFGNSGGPVFNDHQEVVGLAVGILDGTSLAIMVPLNAICGVLP